MVILISSAGCQFGGLSVVVDSRTVAVDANGQATTFLYDHFNVRHPEIITATLVGSINGAKLSSSLRLLDDLKDRESSSIIEKSVAEKLNGPVDQAVGVDILDEQGKLCGRESSTGCASPSSTAFRCSKSAPAQNPRPAPVTTIALTSGSSSASWSRSK